jgi:hypothetical protein
MDVLIGSIIGGILVLLLFAYVAVRSMVENAKRRKILQTVILTPASTKLPTIMNLTRTLKALPENGPPLTEKPEQLKVILANSGIEVPEGNVIPVTLGRQMPLPIQSPMQSMKNLATAFSRKTQAGYRNALAEEVARLRARPNVVTKNGKSYLVVTQSRKRRNRK